jgi:hypothetical protein
VVEKLFVELLEVGSYSRQDDLHSEYFGWFLVYVFKVVAAIIIAIILTGSVQIRPTPPVRISMVTAITVQVNPQTNQIIPVVVSPL